MKTSPGFQAASLALLVALFAGRAAAQIAGLCNTGQTAATSSGCTGVLIPAGPNLFNTPLLDGNWEIGYPYPSPLPAGHAPCLQKLFVDATVSPPNGSWTPNSASMLSEWIMPDGGSEDLPRGYYIFRTKFPVPAVLPGGGVPTGLTINGQLTSDNATRVIYLRSGAGCALVNGVTFPVDPGGGPQFTQWWPVSFTNSLPLVAGSDAYLYVVVGNGQGAFGGSAVGFRMEFFATSAFH